MSGNLPRADFEGYKSVVEAAKREILAALPKPEPWSWKLLVIVLPILLTTGLGYFNFKLQSRTNLQLDRASRELQTRLSLTQDYYRERLTIYKGIHETLVGMREKAQRAVAEPLASTGLEASVTEFNHSYAANSIFLTQDLLASLDGLWRNSANSAMNPPLSRPALKEIVAGASEVEALMRRDLLIDELEAQQGHLHPVTAALESEPAK